MNKSQVPLSLVGHFLNQVGSSLLRHCAKIADTKTEHKRLKVKNPKIFHPRHRVVSLQLLRNGEILTQAIKTEFRVVEDSESPDGYTIVESGQESTVYFKSKAVVIASGAKQVIDPRFVTELYPESPARPVENLIPSDSFLKKEVYLAQMRRLKGTAHPKVVIIGGSHSGFSCAHLLLHGPASISPDVTIDRPKLTRQCAECCHCESDEKLGEDREQEFGQDLCSCVCRCFGE